MWCLSLLIGSAIAVSGGSAACTHCTDAPTSWMKAQGTECAASTLPAVKCSSDAGWVADKTCQRTCYALQRGYADDVCCGYVPGAPPPNRHPTLIPPAGTVWRGATLGLTYGYAPPAQTGAGDKIRAFEEDYTVPLHIYRTFKNAGSNTDAITDHERAFVRSGGILFYSIQPNDWAKAATPAYNWALVRYAAAVKSLAPALVFVAPGYEPDGHAKETQTKAGLVHGTAADYRAMFKHVRAVFAEHNVTNAVFTLDLSFNIRVHPDVLPQLWPGDDAVDWLMYNVFQSKESGAEDGSGDCGASAHDIYNMLEARALTDGIDYTARPWGLGAWGSMNATYGTARWPGKAISKASREACLTGVQQLLDGGACPRLRASIYFNSLNSLVCPREVWGFANSPSLVPAFKRMLAAASFAVTDAQVSSARQAAGIDVGAGEDDSEDDGDASPVAVGVAAGAVVAALLLAAVAVAMRARARRQSAAAHTGASIPQEPDPQAQAQLHDNPGAAPCDSNAL